MPGLPCTPGYDLTTGLGSPKAYGFVYDLATNTLGVVPLHFIDPDWTNFTHRFYRAKAGP